MDEGEKEAFVEIPPHTHEAQPRRFALVRGLGILLLAIPALLVVMGAGTFFYNLAVPSSEARHPAQDYLSMYPASQHKPAPYARSRLLSNGTHMFEPTVVLISIDGFRADYLDRGITPNFQSIGRQGLRADYMLPSFPSSTFPNHYSIVTGLYPGSHGIVSNEFYDTSLNDTFRYKDAAKNRQAQWWQGGEPIWVTAEKHNQTTAIDMWIGSTAEIHGIKPTYMIPFADNVHPTEKIQQLLEWLDLPLDRRPSFLATYIPEVDHEAHERGPDAAQVNNAIKMVDEALGDLWAQLAKRNLTHVVNLMIVSDHGMAASVAHKNAVYLDDYIDVSQVVGIYNWPLAAIQPKSDEEVAGMYKRLVRASAGQPWKVYLRKDIPDRFHYQHPTRVAPLLVVPEVPYYITTHAMDKSQSPGQQSAIGVHGYDNMHPLMRATFVAAGPAFRSRTTAAPMQNASDSDMFSVQLEAGPMVVSDGMQVSDMGAEQEFLDLVHSALVAHEDSGYQAQYDRLWGEGHLNETQLRNIRHPPFENVELYNLMARILNLTAAPNNGTSEFYRWWLK
ncbi:hypothetical protein H4R22_000360 [Coemansia sp. RSA 1290]|nr:hypothetical protein H4R22_000360 [Coemansia sp. RSA 1290]KAJ2652123.1 hypothetical protein IWW40_001320 [Coemansia sp. RSA 1250]